MSNQENILMMDGNGIMKDSNGNVMAKGMVIKSAVISSAPSMEDLVKRIESLEKQLADMQKATSCEKEKLLKLYECKTSADEAFFNSIAP
ncbi:hypothetical protein R2S03_14080 [Hafnia alvei]|uniref:hypothetical protein n=1 Tax=Proteus vulgaris TaxID=585 RepID=UPI00299F2C3A|nr:hypothetical protein [Proteus vulgaris]WOO48602.1 hypothetical protein R2S03_14080 [Hafnia alvei]WPF03066.1 hypothetical protein SB028_12915 [Proteus vulgaris]